MIHKILHLKDHFPFLGENGCDPTVELFLPNNMQEMDRAERKRPCMLICPGGAYCSCSQREGEPYALHMMNEGFNAFVLTYSVHPHAFPTQMREVAALMELICENADQWNCDTEKILICGSSAGGHLAAHYSTMYDCTEVREVFPNSKPVAGTVLCYPVITADARYAHKGSLYNVLGKKELSDEDVAYFSCERHVKASTPPAFIWHTFSDRCVPVMNSMLYANALQVAGVPFELHIYPYGEHGLATSDIHTLKGDPYSNHNYNHVHTWLASLKEWLNVMNFRY